MSLGGAASAGPDPTVRSNWGGRCSSQLRVTYAQQSAMPVLLPWSGVRLRMTTILQHSWVAKGGGSAETASCSGFKRGHAAFESRPADVLKQTATAKTIVGLQL